MQSAAGACRGSIDPETRSMTGWKVSKGFGWKDASVEPEVDPRGDASPTRGERETLMSYLRFQRQTLELKCSGLDPDQLSSQAVPSSELSLLGLVRQMAAVKHGWFQRVVQGDEGARPFRTHGIHSEASELSIPTPKTVKNAQSEWQRQ